MNQDQVLREQLVNLMHGGQTARPLKDLLEGVTLTDAGKHITDVPYTIWQLLEHMRITQWDILEFSRNANHESPAWPDEYWPNSTAPDSHAALDKTIAAIFSDLTAMVQLVQDSEKDLFKPFEHGNGQNLLREAMLVAQHNAYHAGQVILLRRLLGNWNG